MSGGRAALSGHWAGVAERRHRLCSCDVYRDLRRGVADGVLYYFFLLCLLFDDKTFLLHELWCRIAVLFFWIIVLSPAPSSSCLHIFFQYYSRLFIFLLGFAISESAGITLRLSNHNHPGRPAIHRTLADGWRCTLLHSHHIVSANRTVPTRAVSMAEAVVVRMVRNCRSPHIWAPRLLAALLPSRALSLLLSPSHATYSVVSSHPYLIIPSLLLQS